MLLSESKIITKKSQFIGELYSCKSISEYDTILKTIQSKHKKATHICLAYIIDDEIKFKNDREVGSPGKILYNVLNRNKLNNHLIVVIRYFGGVKLGIGGVQRGFRLAGQECIVNADL